MITEQIEVLVPTAVNQGFDYLCPPGVVLQAGDIVTVPFGKKELLGVVWGKGSAAIPAGRLKAVRAHLSQFPPLSESLRAFVDWTAWYACAPKGAILKMVLPVADIGKEGRKAAQPVPDIDLSRMQLADLSDIQQQAAQQLTSRIGAGFSVTLLDGVTGSGKTEVYFEAIAKVLGMRHEARGTSPPMPHASRLMPQVLILLPEIALSIQWLERFEKRFGFTPVVWNSEITPASKRAAWKAIAKGEAPVVVGARSALFLPYKNLSLIIADEEHDGSYKQEEGVIYHARDMAVARARFEKIPAMLVSATPSLETWHNAREGKYKEITLIARHNDAVMPDITLLDMRTTELERGSFISRPLREELAKAIADGHQCMLFLNRRGYAPLLLCRACGYRFQCPACSAWMVVHRKDRHPVAHAEHESTGFHAARDPVLPLRGPQDDVTYLECHHCNMRIPEPTQCPSCMAEGKLAACGPGVERLQEEVKSFLPDARVAVMASDSMGGPKELGDTITAMSEKRIDLLIGTQMIAKGHHFSDLAVVGVVDADLGLSGGDLRASERTYQMLHQLSGRAGRERIRGRVYLQSFLPEHPVIKALVSGERDAFLGAELKARKNAHMPPFTRLAALIVEGEKEEQAMRVAKALATSFPASPQLHLYGPAPAPLFRLRDKFRFRLLVKAKREVNLPNMVRHWVESQEIPSSVRVKIDIDPQGFL